ncbi:non-ribosomal peptide synthetase [Gordonia neofelifaecis]|uniref:Putative non-ribosomal peptide synthetase n=1 Tax=Gordonia neofelifaecis NRRL B-59395 TaxID=644548 RepID=F1YJL6_9ACTN|nr:non-ribosomal peptide synthetase [Gordonia neofelifaecis]EGD54948.1 putative non-ribosomal peptide synthetase [Gordonia neofelifaecis NRRL B-59395]
MTAQREGAQAKPAIEDVLALSPLQSGLFSLSEMAGDGLDVYSMQFVVEISGPLDAEKLRSSVATVMRRHPNLRVSLWDEGVPHPVQIVPSQVDLPWRTVVTAPDEFDDLALAERTQRFDLRHGPAMRVVLAELPGGRHRLLLTAHHILMDGWAIALFFRELLSIYSAGGSADGLPPVKPYRNYIAWLAQQDSAAALTAWSAYLDGAVPLLLGAPGTPVTEPQRHRRTVDREETARILGWARRNGLTPAAVTQYAWSVVLGRLSDRTDVVFGTTISGRPQSLPGAGEMVGLFINTVPVRVDLAAQPTVLEAATAVQRSAARMRDLGFLGLADIARTAGTSNLFDTLFVYENAPIGSATEPVTAADGTRFLPLAMESLSHYPLTVVAYELDGELVVMTESVAEWLGPIDPAQVIERMIAVLRALPEAADAPADTLDALLDHERVWASRPSAGTALPAGTTAIGLFAEQADRTPDALALVADDGTWTYAELLRRARAVAAELQAAGVSRGDVVAVAPRRSGRTVVGLLAAMLAGAAYVPIDVSMPAARIENLLAQSVAGVVLTDSEFADLFPGRTVLSDWPSDSSTAFVPVPLDPTDAAYLIFTSGSTGEPKGVIGTQGALASYARDHRDRVLTVGRERLGRAMRVAHAWTFSFDASWQPLAALLDGHEVHLFSDDETRDAARLVAALGERGIDMIDTTPSMFGQLSAAGLVSGEPGRPTLTVLALGGEAIGPALWRQLGALPRTAVFNCYGPTETTVEAMVARVSESPVPTIAGPTDRMTARVFDSRLRPVPDGVIGELYLTGDQVTRGYQGRPGQTATTFVADPRIPGQRMYRTGDLVRRNAAGDIVFVGRGDDQVKIRGYRIEVGEVEAGLRSVSGVRDAAVIVVDRPIGAALVGFVSGTDTALDSTTVRSELAQRLPSHMIPTRVIVLPVLPVNRNGKLDSTLLTESARAALSGGGIVGGQLDDVEERVAEAVSGVLGTRPGPDDDFFDLGMDSIVAMALVTAIRAGGDEIAARDVMTFPNVRDLAAAVRRGKQLARIAAEREYGEVPALPVVEWMYEGGDWRRFTQTVLFRLPDGCADVQVVEVLQSLLDAHDMLRSTRESGVLVTREPGTVDAASRFWALEGEPGRGTGELVTIAAREANDAIDPDRGHMVAAVRVPVDAGDDLLLLAVHHLAVDAVSWQILFGDIAQAGATVSAGGPVALTAEYTDYRAWSERLLARSGSDEVVAQRDYWRDQVVGDDPVIGERRPEIGRDAWSALRSAPVLTDVDVTEAVLNGIDQRIGMREFLLTALAVTFASWRSERGQDPSAGSLIALEGHGREDATVGDDIDTGRTLGWFTTVFPVRLAAGESLTVDRLEAEPDAGRTILDHVAAELDSIPNRGLDYGLLRYAGRDADLVASLEPQVEFNYLGRFDLGVAGQDPGPWQPVVDLELNEYLPTDPEPDLPLRYALDVVAVVRGTDAGPQLVTNWRYCSTVLSASDVDRLSCLWSRAVTALATILA